jgi:hypothetical protein
VVRLDDRQLKIVMTAAASLPVEKRHAFLGRIAAELERVRRPGDRDVETAARVALKGLLQAPAA